MIIDKDKDKIKKKKLVVQTAREVEAKEVPWLLYPYVIKGAGTLVSGDPGSGKSTILMRIAAALSNGEDLSGKKLADGPQRILYLEMEDDVAWGVKPVLVANKANLDNIYLPIKKDMAGSLTLADTEIINTAKENGCSVIVLGPLTSFFGLNNMNDATCVKTLLQGFLDSCAAENIACLVIHHTTKIKTGSDISSPAGSMQIAGTFRLMYNVYAPKDRWRENYRWIVPVKCNVGSQRPPAICAWELLSDPQDGYKRQIMRWIGETGDDIDEVRSGDAGTPKPALKLDDVVYEKPDIEDIPFEQEILKIG